MGSRWEHRHRDDRRGNIQSRLRLQHEKSNIFTVYEFVFDFARMNTRYASLEELPGYDTVVLRVVLFRDFLWLVHAHPDRTGTAVGRAAPMNFLLLALYVRLPLRRAIEKVLLVCFCFYTHKSITPVGFSLKSWKQEELHFAQCVFRAFSVGSRKFKGRGSRAVHAFRRMPAQVAFATDPAVADPKESCGEDDGGVRALHGLQTDLDL